MCIFLSVDRMIAEIPPKFCNLAERANKLNAATRMQFILFHMCRRLYALYISGSYMRQFDLKLRIDHTLSR